MRICIAGPIATENISHLLLTDRVQHLPKGYSGAPLLGLLIDALLQRGHEVVAITTDPRVSIDAEPVREIHGRFTFVVVGQRKRSFSFSDGHLGRAVDLFRKERNLIAREILSAKVDIIHAHWSYEFAWAAQQTMLPYLITAHDSPLQIAKFSGSIYRWVRAVMAWHVLRRTKNCTAVSPYMANEIKGWVPVSISVVPNPIAHQAFELFEIRSKCAMRIAMVCNGWGARKNAEKAFVAFKGVRAVVPSAELWVWGSDFGPGQYAQKWARSHGLDDGVRFIGPTSHHLLLRQMSTADVLLHPAIEESFGVVIAEAMAMGLRVVAGKRSGAVPWVVGDYGILVDVQDPNEIAEALIRALTTKDAWKTDAEKAHNLTKSRFSIEAVAAQYENLYRYALEVTGK